MGLANNRTIFIPITAVVRNSPRLMDPIGRTWERVLSVTGQPDTTYCLSERTRQEILEQGRNAKTIF